MSLRTYTKEWLEELCKDSFSYSEVLTKAGRKQGGGAQATLRQKIQDFGIDISHFKGQGWNKGLTKETDERISWGIEKYTIQEVFTKDSPVTQKVLRGYIERHQMLEYKCQKCGCDGKWLDGIISLEVDHIDGNNTNNELSNLRYLCPNCHALTETYRGKNKALKAHKDNV